MFLDDIRRDKLCIIRDQSSSFQELPACTTAEKKSKDKLDKVKSKVEQNQMPTGKNKSQNPKAGEQGAVMTSPYYANNYANSLKNMVNLQSMMIENLNHMNDNMNQNIEISHQNLLKQQEVFTK